MTKKTNPPSSSSALAEDRRRKLLDAARELFLREQYDVLAGLTLDRVAERAGVPLRSAKREFTADGLRQAVREDLLRVNPHDDISESDFVAFTVRLTDRDLRLADEIDAIVSLIVEHNVGNDLFKASMAFWAFSAHDPDTRSRLSSMYDEWLRDARDGLSAMFIQQLDAIPLRTDWISIEDFVRAMTAMVEGLAIQLDVNDSDPSALDTGATDLRAGIPPMDPALAGKVAQALLASMIALPDVPSVDELFELIETRRRSHD